MGVAISRAVSQMGLSVALIEKETTVLTGESCHSSGIIWKGGKTAFERQLTTAGYTKMHNFMTKLEIPHKETGALVLAQDNLEREYLQNYHKWCLTNNIESEYYAPSAIKQETNEFHIGDSFLGGVLTNTAIITCPWLLPWCILQDTIKMNRLSILTGMNVDTARFQRGEWTLSDSRSTSKEITCGVVINCTGNDNGVLEKVRLSATEGKVSYPDTADEEQSVKSFRGHFLVFEPHPEFHSTDNPLVKRPVQSISAVKHILDHDFPSDHNLSIFPTVYNHVAVGPFSASDSLQTLNAADIKHVHEYASRIVPHIGDLSPSFTFSCRVNPSSYGGCFLDKLPQQRWLSCGGTQNNDMTLSVCFGMGELVAAEASSIIGKGKRSDLLSDGDIYDPQLTTSNYLDSFFPRAFPPILSSSGTFDFEGQTQYVTHPLTRQGWDLLANDKLDSTDFF